MNVKNKQTIKASCVTVLGVPGDYFCSHKSPRSAPVEVIIALPIPYICSGVGTEGAGSSCPQCYSLWGSATQYLSLLLNLYGHKPLEPPMYLLIALTMYDIMKEFIEKTD